MTKSVRIAMLVVCGIAITASILFVMQGGFGGGHGDFDKAIFALGLPWALIPWPQFLVTHDFVWLIGLPLALNLSVVFALRAGARVLRTYGRTP